MENSSKEKPLQKRIIRTIMITCITITVIFILASLILPKFATTGAIRGPYCPNHLMQLACALHVYFNDNGEFPTKLISLWPEYLEDKILFKCPKAKEDSIESYIYLQMLDMSPFENSIIIFDVKGNHDGYRNVILSTIRYKRMNESEFKLALKTILDDPEHRKLYTKKAIEIIEAILNERAT